MQKPRNAAGGSAERRGESHRPLCGGRLIERKIADEFAGLSVHGKGIFFSVPGCVQQPHGIERILCLSAMELHRAALGIDRCIA